MNKVILSGYIASDIELKTTNQGTSVTNFRLAVRRPRTKNDMTDFLTIVAWRSNAEFISKYFHKGSGIELSGIVTTRKWQDKDGNDRYATEIVVEDVDFGKGSKDGGKSSNESSYQEPQQGGFTEYNDDDEDLPF